MGPIRLNRRILAMKRSLLWHATTICLIFLLATTQLTIAKPIGLATDPPYVLPDGKVGADYEFQFEADGGAGTQKWRVINGQLPEGLKLESSGKLHGILD